VGRKYLKMVERDDGWCDWAAPIPGYRMMCCDCGLVHVMEFKVVQQTGPEGKGGWWPARTPRSKGLRVLFRAKRDNRATAARRKRKKDGASR
jgi:hypothetical protein